MTDVRILYRVELVGTLEIDGLPIITVQYFETLEKAESFKKEKGGAVITRVQAYDPVLGQDIDIIYRVSWKRETSMGDNSFSIESGHEDFSSLVEAKKHAKDIPGDNTAIVRLESYKF